jgi:hypothetical protein
MAAGLSRFQFHRFRLVGYPTAARFLSAAHDLVFQEPIVVSRLRPVFDAGQHEVRRTSLVLARTRFGSLAAPLLRNVVSDQQDAVGELNLLRVIFQLRPRPARAGDSVTLYDAHGVPIRRSIDGQERAPKGQPLLN